VISFPCPHCAEAIQHDPDMAGLRVACPRCTRYLLMPPAACALDVRTGIDPQAGVLDRAGAVLIRTAANLARHLRRRSRILRRVLDVGLWAGISMCAVLLAVFLAVWLIGLAIVKDQRPPVSESPPAVETTIAEALPETEAEAVPEPEAEPVPKSDPFAARVIKASPQQLDYIQAMVKEGFTVDPEVVYAVRSSDHVRAFYIAARVYGLQPIPDFMDTLKEIFRREVCKAEGRDYIPPVDYTPQIAVWFITGEPDHPGVIRLVNAEASRCSYDELPWLCYTRSELENLFRPYGDCIRLIEYVREKECGK